MDTSFEQFVRQDLREIKQGQQRLKEGLCRLKEGQRRLEKAISDGETRIIRWVVGLLVGTAVIAVGLSSALLMSFMLAR